MSFQSGQLAGRRHVEYEFGYPSWAITIPGRNRIVLGENKAYDSTATWSIMDLDTGKTLETWQMKGFAKEYEPKENGVYLQASSTFAYIDGDGKVWFKSEGKEARASDLALPMDFYPASLLEVGDSLLAVKSDRRWLVDPATGSVEVLPALAHQVLAMLPLGDTGNAVALYYPSDFSARDDDLPLNLAIMNPMSGAIVSKMHTGEPYYSSYNRYEKIDEMIDENFIIRTSKDGTKVAVCSIHFGGSLHLYQAPEWKRVTVVATQDDNIFDLDLDPSGTLMSIQSSDGYDPSKPAKDDFFVSDLSGNRVWTIDMKAEMVSAAKGQTALMFWAALALLFVELLLAQYLTSRAATTEFALSLANKKWMLVLIAIELVAFTYYYVNLQMNIEWGIMSRGFPIIVALLALFIGSTLNVSSTGPLAAIGAAAIVASFGLNWIYAAWPKGDLLDTTREVTVWTTSTARGYALDISEGSGAFLAPLQTFRMCVLVLGLDALLSAFRIRLGPRKR